MSKTSVAVTPRAESPHTELLARRPDPDTQRIFDNRVYKHWYTRYAPVLEDDDRLMAQPYEEVERCDEEIAMRNIYGARYTKSNKELNNDRNRRAALIQFQQLKEKREKRALKDQNEALALLRADRDESPTVDSILLARRLRNPESHMGSYKYTSVELKVMANVLNFWMKLRAKAKRKNVLKNKYHRGWTLQNSRWRVLHMPKAKTWLRKKYKALRSAEVRNWFCRAIRLVCGVVRFLNVCSQMAGHAKELFKVKDPNTDEFGNKIEGKFIFDPSKFKISTSTVLDEEAMFSLSKPFFNRSEEEIQRLMKSLQVLRCFAELPASTQRTVATVSWYISVPENKIVIRQAHEAKNCYILLSGKVIKNVYEGNPYVYKSNLERGGFRTLRSYTKDSIFGEEALTKPGSIRDYSILAGHVDCEALSISVDDYFQACMVPKDERQNAPEHLKFISNCNFLKSFPKSKLVEEADENIFMAYFSPNTTVEKSMDEALWVYVVKHGSARSLVELKPLPKVVAKHEQELARKKFFSKKGSLAPSIAEEIDLDLLKSEQEDLYTERSVSITEQQRQLAIASILEKDMTVLDYSIAEETRLVKRKLGSLSSRLFNLRKKEEEAKKLAAIDETEESETRVGSRESHHHLAKSVSRFTDSSMPYGHSRTNLEVKPIFRQSSDAAESSRHSIKKKISFMDQDDIFDDDDDKESSIASDVKRRDSRCHRKQSILSGTQMSIESAAKVTYLPETKGNDSDHSSGSSLKSKESEDNRRKSRLMSIRRSTSTRSSKSIPFCVKGKHLVDEEDPANRRWSTWKLKKTLAKGDQIGYEWVDLHDGSFRPPDEDQSLVSDGAELVMIRKTFLYKYLSEHQEDVAEKMKSNAASRSHSKDETSRHAIHD